jgi:hypothetical protein
MVQGRWYKVDGTRWNLQGIGFRLQNTEYMVQEVEVKFYQSLLVSRSTMYGYRMQWLTRFTEARKFILGSVDGAALVLKPAVIRSTTSYAILEPRTGQAWLCVREVWSNGHFVFIQVFGGCLGRKVCKYSGNTALVYHPSIDVFSFERGQSRLSFCVTSHSNPPWRLHRFRMWKGDRRKIC